MSVFPLVCLNVCSRIVTDFQQVDVTCIVTDYTTYRCYLYSTDRIKHLLPALSLAVAQIHVTVKSMYFRNMLPV